MKRLAMLVLIVMGMSGSLHAETHEGECVASIRSVRPDAPLTPVPVNLAPLCCACKCDTSLLQTEIDRNADMIDMLKTSTGQLQSQIDALDMSSSVTLRVLTGFINTTNPPTLIRGSGFSLSGVSPGATDVTFSTPFSSPPTVIATLNLTGSTGAPAAVSNVTTTGCRVQTYTTGSFPHTFTAQQVFFVVIGN